LFLHTAKKRIDSLFLNKKRTAVANGSPENKATEKDPEVSGSFSELIRTKGMGEIFHGQTKGYMFACDQLHAINIT